ncbi:putative ethylene-responsive binding factor-associated repression, Ninja family [Medicago truncatula]|uniref:Ninja-family protein n=1 Tax=Medicago truncatula TaxID=3880 RepID=A0A072TLM1_MEDTR|nr:ninja-family protein AFP3 [Medicago truncatula]KEH18131.1 ninja-family protein AFP1 [Medicago truncatula]RHN39026.1 putative ethylene-responsive binding factor-associated repression, Ninja family [Medicago truncatula]
MVEVEEIELDLGLSIGGAFKKSKPESRPDKLISLGHDVGLEQNQQPQMKREIQALRRMEVKRKRVQKRETCLETGDLKPECEQVFKREKTDIVDGVVSWMTPLQVVQRPQQYETLRYRLSLPFSFGSEKNEGRINGVGFNGGDGKVKSNGSSRCSSAISDYQSSSPEDGGSTESRSRSHSANSFAEPTHLKETIQTQPNGIKLNEQSAAAATKTDQIPIPIKKSLPQMPYVSTKGNGSNGKVVNGFLYRYSKCDEVSIVCVCHGSTFSPAEFVQHAGGTDITHPLRHITVNSSAFS